MPVNNASATLGHEHLQLKDRVYQYLRKAIIDGDFEIGTALRELDLSSLLGVSKTPVREAFVRLQSERFVELIPYRGAVVAGYSRQDLREIYEVRELVEGRCAARAALSDDDELRRALQHNVRETRKAVKTAKSGKSGDVISKDADVITLFEDFDRLLYAQSNNKWITDIIADLEGHQRRVGRPTAAIPGRIQRSAKEHEQICDAIVRRDPTAAETLMRSHVLSVMNDQLESFVDAESDGH